MTERARYNMETKYGFVGAIAAAAEMGWTHADEDVEPASPSGAPSITGREIAERINAGWCRPIQRDVLRAVYGRAYRTARATRGESDE